MAVLDAHPGLTTEIIVNNVSLTEYRDDEAEESPQQVTKYVEASSGDEFVITTTLNMPFPDKYGVEVRVSVDGNQGPRWRIKPDDRFYGTVLRMKGMNFTQDGKRYHQNYQFAKLNIVEDIEAPIDMKSLQKDVKLKGCIEVSYRWITNFGTSAVPEKLNDTQKPSIPGDQTAPITVPRKQLPVVGNIPEKALKGDTRSHQAMLGEPKAEKARRRPRMTYDYVDRNSFGIMRFKYRSLDALKALRIIIEEEPQLEPAPKPSPDVEQHTANVRNGRKSRSSQRGLWKQENTKQDPGLQNRIKRENSVQCDGQEESDDLVVVKTRSCKRPRRDDEVIVLD